MTRSKDSVLFLGKAGDVHCARALEFCCERFNSVSTGLGSWGDPLPPAAAEWTGDHIISYLSRWVVPADLLARAKKSAINFHPASPDYPGIGCNNFALYENASQYGVTCHHMAANVDTGRIIAVRRFPIHQTDDVAALLGRTYENQLALFEEIISGIAESRPLPESSEQWKRKPFTRREFNELFVIRPEMTHEEIARRIRAVSFGEYQPYMEIAGYRFQYRPE